jgi:hypothetical protein
LTLFRSSEDDHKRLDEELERNKKGNLCEVKMMAICEMSDMCFVRVCPVFYTLKMQALFLRYYIKKHHLVPLYRLLMCCTILKSTHIIIIISTKVQYSIVSVPAVWIRVI